MEAVNNTPVRTANNFRINNIEVDMQIPEKIPVFDNVQITKEHSQINEQTLDKRCTYGISKKLEDIIISKANSKIRIENNEKKEDVRITYIFDDENLILRMFL